ncbi:MarR family winged helix-turn-helix transcriptional regulator [Streptomyces sp. PT12]|uniref:MarR family winged helix-turn-helix transcriptional regulator n=1 Tax=Streptomyces sp. PT12 TaxID=1510197 RepID=UPI000DE40E30|nr:MarR family transcriptional regulator [Streptomyces sp. PT12]RBM23023.1 MarR family transcriptional regulator [Streptomyces sp. PT12]
MNDHAPDISRTAARAAGDVWVVFTRLRRRINALDEAKGLSSAQASVLMRLDKAGPASASDLAAVERVRPQSMARTVAALEDAGLVERRPDPDDGRRQLIELTRTGRERRLDDRRAREAWLARSLQEHGTREQLQAVIDAMELLDAVAQS